MNKKTVTGLTAGAILIILILLLYFSYYRGGPQQNILPPATPSRPSTAALPAAKAPAGIPAPQELTPRELTPQKPTPQESTPQKPPAPPIAPVVPSKVGAPGSEVTPPAPTAKVSPPKKQKESYGFLVYRYRNYGRASKMQEKMKKRGVFGFIQPAPKNPDLSELWAGPFSDIGEARAAEKSLRDLLNAPRKIHKIQSTIPK